MWPTGFRAFNASSELTRLARLARDSARREEDLPQLDLTSSRLPDPRTTFDEASAQEAIGERILSLLSALALSSDCAPSKLLVLSDDRNLAADVRASLAEYFGLASKGA